MIDLYVASIPFRALAGGWLIVCGLICSIRVTRSLLPDADALLRWSTIFSVGTWLSTIGFHLLFALHAFDLGFALLAASAALSIAIVTSPANDPLARGLQRELRSIVAIARRVRRGRYFATWCVFGVFAVPLALRAFVIPPLGWDTLTYHAPRAAQWVQGHRFTFDEGVGSYDFYRHFFSGGEVLMAWAMLPFHGDLLANLGTVVQWIGVGLSSWALARAIGVAEPFAGTSAALVMFAPTMQLEVNSGYVELPLDAALLQGIALALHCLRRPRPGSLVACAMALGVATGIKLPAAPPAAIFALLVAIRFMRSSELGPARRSIVLGVCALVVLAPATPWMLRAWIDTGYPLSPLPIELFGHKLGVASAMLRWYGERKLEPYTWPVEWSALSSVFSPPNDFNESLGGLSLIPLALFPIGLAALALKRPIVAIALFCAALLPVLAHFSQAMTPVRLTRQVTASRFLFPTLALAIPVSFAWCRVDVRRHQLPFWSAAYRSAALSYPLAASLFAWRRGAIEWENRELVIVAILIAQLGWIVIFSARRNAKLAAAIGVASFMLVCTVAQIRRDKTRPLAYDKSFALHGFPRFWTPGVALVDEPARPHRIAITGGPDHGSDKWFHYFFLGRRLQNWIGYVVPTRDGKVAQFGPGGELPAQADLPSWLQRLAAARIDEVLTFPPRSIEQGWMDRTPQHFIKLTGKEDWGLYRFQP